MTPDSPNIDSIYLAATEMPSDQQRSAYLDQACGADTELRKRVDRLLAAQSKVGSFLEAPAPEFNPTVDQPITEAPGTVIGPYKLLQQIGEGGMGVVYMADQTEPIKRRVALKIIKPGMDTRQVIARFEAERQALAMMDHPNIAKVHDAGATESGRPYFVMELVNGVPLTQYCDEQQLTPKQRLELFIPICQAVQHAHQKGIIHRDLKPSNVLVALYDSRAVPQVIDFGVAKATSQSLTEKTMFTQLGQIVGTLEYMSPEQAQPNQLDIDTRSDIYSLGVLLYELLTGETPLDRERLRSAAFDEMLRIIREEEPPKPSLRLSGSDALPSIAANRRIEPKRLSSLVRGELDWIVMKALEKDRARRYETANGFAQDIERYLNDERVIACPPSAGYRFRKFARRNKAALLTTTLVGAVLLVSTVVSACLAIQAIRAEKRADRSLTAERAARSEADEARDRELRQKELARQRTEQHNNKLREVLATLDGLRGDTQSSSLESDELWAKVRQFGGQAESLAASDLTEPTLAERARALAQQLGGEEADRKIVSLLAEARVLADPASARPDDPHKRSRFRVLEWNTANQRLEQALAVYEIDPSETPPEQAAARIRGRPSDVRLAVLAALDQWIESIPVEQPDRKTWLRAVVQAADDDPWRIRLRKLRKGRDGDALAELAVSAEFDQQTPHTLLMLGKSLAALELRKEGIAVLKRARGRYPDDFWLNDALVDELLRSNPPQLEEALRFATTAVAIRPSDAGVAQNLGSLLEQAGRLEEAADAYRRALDLNPDQRSLRFRLGRMMEQSQRWGEAAKVYKTDGAFDHSYCIVLHPRLGPREIVGISRDSSPADSDFESFRDLTEHLTLDHSYGIALSKSGRPREAAEVLRASAVDLEIELSRDLIRHFDSNNQALPMVDLVVKGYREWARCLRELARAEEAETVERLADEALLAQERIAAADSRPLPDEALAAARRALTIMPDNQWAHERLVRVLGVRGEAAEAVRACRKLLKLKPTGRIYNEAIETLKRLGQWDALEEIYREEILRDPSNNVVPFKRGLAWLLALGHQADKRKPDEAVRLAEQVVERVPQYDRHWRVLAQAYYQAGRLEEAGRALQKANSRHTEPVAHDLLLGAMIDWRAGLQQQARDKYRKAVERPLGVRFFDKYKSDIEPGAYLPFVLRLRVEAAALLEIESRTQLAGAYVMRAFKDHAFRVWMRAGVDSPGGGIGHRGEERIKAAIQLLRDAEQHDPLGPDQLAKCRNLRIACEELLELRWSPDLPDISSTSTEVMRMYACLIELDPDNAVAHFRLGLARMSLNRLDEAAESVRNASRLKTGLKKAELELAHYNLATLYLGGGQFEEALAEFEKLFELKPRRNLAKAWTNRGSCLEQLSRVDEAIECYEMAIQINRNLPEAHYNFGRIYMRKEDFHEAVKSFETAVRNYTVRKNNRERLGGHDQQTRQTLRQSLQLLSDACARLATAQVAEGEFDAASETCQLAIETLRGRGEEPFAVTPDLRDLRLLDLCWRLAARGEEGLADGQQPVQPAELVLELTGRDPEILFQHAAWELLRGNHEAYNQLCNEALQRFGQEAEVRTDYLVARMVCLTSRPSVNTEEAISLAERSLEIDPNKPWRLHASGLAHLRAGQLEPAIELFTQSSQQTWEAHVVNWLGLAVASHKIGRTDEAGTWLEKAVEWIDVNPLDASELHLHDRIACRLLLREAESLINQ